MATPLTLGLGSIITLAQNIFTNTAIYAVIAVNTQILFGQALPALARPAQPPGA